MTRRVDGHCPGGQVLPALVLVAACAHAPDPGLRLEPSPAAGATTEVFEARDGTDLAAVHWKATGEPRGVVVIMHGLKGHTGHYAAFVGRLTAAGFQVYAFDLRGYGRSAGPRVAPRRWVHYADEYVWSVPFVEPEVESILPPLAPRNRSRVVHAYTPSMVDHRATITWQGSATPADFVKLRYSREHTWAFDGGVTVPGSSAPSVVPAPWSNAAHVDPEEAFVASIASCHMLTFLYVAAKAGIAVANYRDEAVGVMTKNERGVPWVSKVTLAPAIVYAGDRRPSADELASLHHAAHDQCFIACSVRTEIVVATW